MIIAGIITYNPDLERLEVNINAILREVDKLVLIDNDSTNIFDINQLMVNYPTIEVIRNLENKGVAKALNQEAEYALNNGYEWLLSLDQDSVVPQNFIMEYMKYISIENVGMICCKIIDRNFGELKCEQVNRSGIEYVNTCITSASMIRVTAWQNVCGFSDDMFIDSVDFDMCYSLIEKGYKILRTNNVALLHEVGHSRKVHFCGKEELVFNHSPFRCYYIIRNTIYLGRKHRNISLLKQFLLASKRFILVLSFEVNKIEKFKSMIKGFYHGFTIKIEKNES